MFSFPVQGVLYSDKNHLLQTYYTHVYICSKVTNSQFSCKYIYRNTSNYSLHLIKVGGKERIKNYRLQKWWNKHTWHKSNTCETCLFYYNIMLNKNNEKNKNNQYDYVFVELMLNKFEIKRIRRNVLEWPTCILMERNGTELFSFIGRLIWFTHNSLRYIWFFQFLLIFYEVSCLFGKRVFFIVISSKGIWIEWMQHDSFKRFFNNM